MSAPGCSLTVRLPKSAMFDWPLWMKAAVQFRTSEKSLPSVRYWPLAACRFFDFPTVRMIAIDGTGRSNPDFQELAAESGP